MDVQPTTRYRDVMRDGWRHACLWHTRKLRAVAIYLLFIAIGAVAHWRFRRWDEVKEELLIFLWYMVVPAVCVAAGVFAWKLYIAPFHRSTQAERGRNDALEELASLKGRLSGEEGARKRGLRLRSHWQTLNYYKNEIDSFKLLSLSGDHMHGLQSLHGLQSPRPSTSDVLNSRSKWADLIHCMMKAVLEVHIDLMELDDEFNYDPPWAEVFDAPMPEFSGTPVTKEEALKLLVWKLERIKNLQGTLSH